MAAKKSTPKPTPTPKRDAPQRYTKKQSDPGTAKPTRGGGRPPKKSK